MKITTNKQAAFMADAQIPCGLEALNGTISQPAWKGKPSWYLVVSEDKMIPPDAQLAMSKRRRNRRRGEVQPCHLAATAIEAALQTKIEP